MRFQVVVAACTVSLTLAVTAASAQQSEPAPAVPAQLASVAPDRSRVLAGTLVEVEIAEMVSSRVVKAGDMFAIRLAAPIKLDGAVLVPEGATGKGQVVDVGRAGIMGNPAKLVLAARYLEHGGVRIPLRAFHLGRVGRDNDNVLLATMLVPVAGLLMPFVVKGGEIEVPPGVGASAKLAADIFAPDLPAASVAPPVLP